MLFSFITKPAGHERLQALNKIPARRREMLHCKISSLQNYLSYDLPVYAFPMHWTQFIQVHVSVLRVELSVLSFSGCFLATTWLYHLVFDLPIGLHFIASCTLCCTCPSMCFCISYYILSIQLI